MKLNIIFKNIILVINCFGFDIWEVLIKNGVFLVGFNII